MADATAFVSAYPAENLDLVLHGLKSATPHLRRELARRAICDAPQDSGLRKMPVRRLRPK